MTTRFARALDMANAISAEVFMHGTCTDEALMHRGFHPDEIRALRDAAEALQRRRPVTLDPITEQANGVRLHQDTAQ